MYGNERGADNIVATYFLPIKSLRANIYEQGMAKKIHIRVDNVAVTKLKVIENLISSEKRDSLNAENPPIINVPKQITINPVTRNKIIIANHSNN